MSKLNEKLNERLVLTPRDVEMYVLGIYDLYVALGGDGLCKSYDPLTIETRDDGTMIAHSYVLNLHDGGRRHSFTSLPVLADEALREFREDLRRNYGI